MIDDPFKDRADAESPVIRQKARDWYTSTFLTRMHKDSKIVIIHTRWHIDDITGRLLKLEEE